MSKRRLAEDRAMRDAALEIFRTDLTQIKMDLKSKGVGGRIADRLGDGARDMAEDAATAAEANYGKIAALAVGGALWAFRNPLLSLVEKLTAQDHSVDDAPGTAGERAEHIEEASEYD